MVLASGEPTWIRLSNSRAAGVDMSGVDAILEKIRSMEITDYNLPWQQVVKEAQAALDEAARK